MQKIEPKVTLNPMLKFSDIFLAGYFYVNVRDY